MPYLHQFYVYIDFPLYRIFSTSGKMHEKYVPQKIQLISSYRSISQKYIKNCSGKISFLVFCRKIKLYMVFNMASDINARLEICICITYFICTLRNIICTIYLHGVFITVVYITLTYSITTTNFVDIPPSEIEKLERKVLEFGKVDNALPSMAGMIKQFSLWAKVCKYLWMKLRSTLYIPAILSLIPSHNDI